MSHRRGLSLDKKKKSNAIQYIRKTTYVLYVLCNVDNQDWM